MTKYQLLAATVSALFLSACASTSTYGTDPIELESTATYEFNDDDSFARNVAYMTGKTKGLRDKDNFADAQLEITRGSVAIDAGLGLLQGGLVSALGNYVSGSTSRGAISLDPTYMVLMEDTKPVNGDYSDDVLARLESEFGEIFSKTEGVELFSVAKTTIKTSGHNIVVFWYGDVCDQLSSEGKLRKMPKDRLMKYFPSIADFDGCAMSIKASIPWFYKDKLVLVIEQVSGLSIEQAIVRAGGIGYTFIPSTYVLDQRRINVAFPFVLHDETVHLFSTDDLSFPLSELDNILELIQSE